MENFSCKTLSQGSILSPYASPLSPDYFSTSWENLLIEPWRCSFANNLLQFPLSVIRLNQCSISCETLSVSFPRPESCDLSLARSWLSLFSFIHSSIFLPKYHGWFFIPGILILSFSSQSILRMRFLASCETFLFLGKTTVLDTWNVNDEVFFTLNSTS